MKGISIANEDEWRSFENDADPPELATSMLQTDLEVKSHCVNELRLGLEFHARLGLLQMDFPLCNASHSLELLQEESPSLRTKNRGHEVTIISSYMAFYVACVLSMMYFMTHPPHHLYKEVEYRAPRCKVVSDTDVEEKTWKESWIGWLAVSWASPWVARWGHSQEPLKSLKRF